MSGLGRLRRPRHCRRIYRWPLMKSHNIFAVRYLVRCTSLQLAHDVEHPFSPFGGASAVALNLR